MATVDVARKEFHVSSTTATLDVDTAQEIAWGESFDDYEFVATQEIAQHRWYTARLIVFKQGGHLFGFHYLDPATEMQDGQDRFESDPVPIFPVDGEVITTTVYKAAA
jgi:hypothetical protein